MTNIEFNRGAINASDCVGQGWGMVTQNFGIYVGTNLVAIIILFIAGLIPFAGVLLTAPITGGLYYIALKNIDGEPINFGMMFKGFEKFLPLLLISLIQGIPTIILTIIQYSVNLYSVFGLGGIMPPASRGNFFQAAQPNVGALAGVSAIIFAFAAAFIIFSIIWNLIFYFAVPIMIDRQIGAVEAITLSARGAFSNIGGLILLFILEFFVALLGIIAICLGLLVAIPVIWAANAVAYRMVFPRLDQNVWSTPPPPSAYSTSFGQGT